MLNHRVCDNNNVDNSTSGDDEVQGGDAVALTHENVSGTGSTDGATVEKTSKMGSESLNLPPIGIIDATGKAYNYKACRGTGKIGLDDDENGGS